MKLLKKLLAMMLALTCVFAVSACDKEEDGETTLDTSKTGWAFTYDEETEYDEETDTEKEYLVITGLFLSDSIKYEIGTEDFKPVDVEIGKDGKVEVPVYNKNEVQYENNALKTEVIDIANNYAGIKIASAAFINQLFIGSVKIHSSVVEIGISAFAGCTNLTKMELPFVGQKATGAVNTAKTFAYLFGTSESADCTSVTSAYNNSGSATYYVPTSLEEVVVNYAEGSALVEYAFNGVTTLKTVTVNGINKVSRNAFAGCTGLYTVNLPDGVTEIGKSAFSGCTSLINFAFPASLNTIFQEAFNGCTRLGYGKATTLVIPAVNVYEKAFYGCTAISKVKLDNVAVIGDAAFYNCSSLKVADSTIKAGAEIADNAFTGCAE